MSFFFALQKAISVIPFTVESLTKVTSPQSLSYNPNRLEAAPATAASSAVAGRATEAGNVASAEASNLSCPVLPSGRLPGESLKMKQVKGS